MNLSDCGKSSLQVSLPWILQLEEGWYLEYTTPWQCWAQLPASPTPQALCGVCIKEGGTEELARGRGGMGWDSSVLLWGWAAPGVLSGASDLCKPTSSGPQRSGVDTPPHLGSGMHVVGSVWFFPESPNWLWCLSPWTLDQSLFLSSLLPPCGSLRQGGGC